MTIPLAIVVSADTVEPISAFTDSNPLNYIAMDGPSLLFLRSASGRFSRTSAICDGTSEMRNGFVDSFGWSGKCDEFAVR